MSLKIGERLPDASLQEFNAVETEGCPVGPREVKPLEVAAGKTIALFALPGAYTPTCSAKHVPGYLEHRQALKDAGVDEVWCVSVNDAFVMGAWARDQKAEGSIRFLGDGSGTFTEAAGLTLDLRARGLGVRSQRYSALVVDGVVRTLNVEAPGAFAVSDAATMLAQARALRA